MGVYWVYKFKKYLYNGIPRISTPKRFLRYLKSDNISSPLATKSIVLLQKKKILYANFH